MSTQVNQRSGCLASILGLLGLGKRGPKVYPYRVRDNFLSDAERSFYGVLKLVVGDRAVIFSKVGLREIFYVAHPNKNPGAMWYINQKHVNFLLCAPNTVQPIVGIELDDRSHQDKDRQERDAQVDLAFQTAQLPLLHIPAQYSYNTSEIAAQLSPYLDGEPVTARRAERSACIATDFWIIRWRRSRRSSRRAGSRCAGTGTTWRGRRTQTIQNGLAS